MNFTNFENKKPVKRNVDGLFLLGGSLEARTPDPLIKSQPSRRSQLYKLLRNRLILLGFPGFIASQLFAKNHRFSSLVATFCLHSFAVRSENSTVLCH